MIVLFPRNQIKVNKKYLIINKKKQSLKSFLFKEYPLNTLSTSVRDYLNEIFDTQSKLKAITLCRNGIINPHAGKKKLLFFFV
jgi:hypothetical protein